MKFKQIVEKTKSVVEEWFCVPKPIVRTPDELADLIQAAYIQRSNPRPNTHNHRYYPSTLGFCLNKIRLQRMKGMFNAANSWTYIGTVCHEDLRNVVRQMDGYWNSHGKTWLARLLHYRLRPRYEVHVEWKSEDSEHPITISGYVDIDFPALDTCVEFKTSSKTKGVSEGDELLNAYMMQGNFYTVARKRKHSEIWLFHTMAADFYTNQFIQIVQFDANTEGFWEYVKRAYEVEDALNKNEIMVGPEHEWDCNHCNTYKDCEHRQLDLQHALDMLPCTSKKYKECGLSHAFEQLKAFGTVEYDRSKKLWRRAIQEDTCRNCKNLKFILPIGWTCGHENSVFHNKKIEKPKETTCEWHVIGVNEYVESEFV